MAYARERAAVNPGLVLFGDDLLRGQNRKGLVIVDEERHAALPEEIA